MSTTIQNYRNYTSHSSSVDTKNMVVSIGIQVAARAAKLVASKYATKNDSIPMKYYH